ncbi:hypothetical protein [Deinococcus sp. UYEF24]
MNEERFLDLVNSPLSKHMIYFVDMYEDEAEEQMRSICKSGYTKTLRRDRDYLQAFLAAEPDRIWVRDFVEIEMNLSLDDPTGQLHMNWLKDALIRMNKVLEDESRS